MGQACQKGHQHPWVHLQHQVLQQFWLAEGVDSLWQQRIRADRVEDLQVAQCGILSLILHTYSMGHWRPMGQLHQQLALPESGQPARVLTLGCHW